MNKNKTIRLWKFDKSTTNYLSELILEELTEAGIETCAYAFHIKVEYQEDKANE
jgi:hypothetical protein